MSDGVDWNENISYSDRTNSEIQMNWYVKDPIAFYFSRSSTNKPGTVFNYSGVYSYLLQLLIKLTTTNR